MPKTIRQSIEKIAKPQGVLEVATVIDVSVLARDTNGVVLSVAPAVTANIHGIGGLQRIELSSGIDPLKVNVGDQLHVTQVQGRYLAVAPLPISNRTKGGGESYGVGEGEDYIAQPAGLRGQIAGSSLELTWQPVQGADYYEIWSSGSADPSSVDTRVEGRTATTSWTSKGSGQYFDDSVYYTVVPHVETGTLGLSGAPAGWIQPAFTGNYASGMTSKNQTTNIPGSMTVTKAGSILRADVTSLDNAQPFKLDVCDPMGTHPTTAPFAVNDILRMVDTSGNVLWVKVTVTSDQLTFWRYTVTKQSPVAGTNYTIKSGSQVADWGASGQGVFAVSADGTFGAGTLWTILTHAGSPWTTTTNQVYANSSGQVVAGAGNLSLDASGLRLIQGAIAANYIGWDTTIVAGVPRVNMTASITASIAALVVTANSNSAATQSTNAQINFQALDSTASSRAYFTLETSNPTSIAQIYGNTLAGLSITNVNGAVVPLSLLHLASTAPTFRMQDTTASAKSLLVTTDANVAKFEEAAASGVGANIFLLDLSGGQVNLGNATFNTWDALIMPLQLGGNASIAGERATGTSASLYASQNAYYNGSNWVYISTSQASNYYQNAGVHVWRVTASGTAGANITWTTGLTIGNGGAYYGSMDTMTYASTISLDVTKPNLHKTTTVNATGNATINASAAGTAGQHIWVEIINDATSGKTITFGTNFKPSATVVGTTSKAAMLHFVSDGINFYEVSRTLAL